MTKRTENRIAQFRFFHRVMSKVKKHRHARPGCWMWKGNSIADKYGFYIYGKVWVTVEGIQKALQAHRVVWELHTGETLAGAVLVNKCGDTLCVNPAHWTKADHWRHA